MILVLLALVIHSLMGLPLAVLLGRDLGRASIAGVSFLLGSGLANALQFVLSMFGPPQPGARFSFVSAIFDLMTVICAVNPGIILEQPIDPITHPDVVALLLQPARAATGW